MKKLSPNYTVLAIVAILSILLTLAYKLNLQLAAKMTSKDCVPTFLDGGGPYYQANTPFRENLAPEDNDGDPVIVKGKVLGPDCRTPQSNVIVDIWQANESGNYDDAWYRGRIKTNEDGSYQFVTVIPKGYGAGTAYRPPHIHFKIWRDDQLLITSQMFLPASKDQGIEDAYIVDLSKSITGNYIATHDIILQ